MARFPGWVYRHGEDPDPRFSLANERTFLAWTRTCLALVAAGVALDALSLPLQPDLRRAASLTLLGLGVLTPPAVWWRWARTERALRTGGPLPDARLSLLLTIGLLVVVVLVAVAAVVR